MSAVENSFIVAAPDEKLLPARLFKKAIFCLSRIFSASVNQSEWSIILQKCWLAPVWPDWAIYWTLGNFSKLLAKISLPKSPKFFGKFCKGLKIFNFLVKSFLGNFYRYFIWRLFTGHTVRKLKSNQIADSERNRFGTNWNPFKNFIVFRIVVVFKILATPSLFFPLCVPIAHIVPILWHRQRRTGYYRILN